MVARGLSERRALTVGRMSASAFAPGVQLGRGVEVVLGCEILNRMTDLGRPVSYRIGR